MIDVNWPDKNNLMKLLKKLLDAYKQFKLAITYDEWNNEYIHCMRMDENLQVV